MREIKFRAKRLDNGEWSYGSGLLIADDFCVIDTDTEMYIDEEYDWAGNTHLFRVAGAMCDLKTLGQYTGFKDKNGKEIYEADIIRYTDVNSHSVDHIGDGFTSYIEHWATIRKDVVVFSYGTFLVNGSPLAWVGFDTIGDLKDCLGIPEDEDCDVNGTIIDESLLGIEVISNIYDNKNLLGEVEL